MADDIDERLAKLNAELVARAARRKRNEPETIMLFLEQVVVPELRAISGKLERIEQILGKSANE